MGRDSESLITCDVFSLAFGLDHIAAFSPNRPYD